LIRAGVPKQIAMMLVGHETESMAKRYSILNEGMVTEFADGWTDSESSRKVWPVPDDAYFDGH
jgi:hypothetical protein